MVQIQLQYCFCANFLGNYMFTEDQICIARYNPIILLAALRPHFRPVIDKLLLSVNKID